MRIFNRRIRINFRLLFVLALTALALYISMPKTPIAFSFGGKQYNFTLEHPRINWVRREDGSYVIQRDLKPRLGLDLQGGTHVVLEADMSNIPAAQRDEALELSKNVIERRVNLYGVSEPTIQTSKNGESYRVIIELAGVKDVNEVIKLIGQTARLEFKEVQQTGEATGSAGAAPFNLLDTGLSGADLERAEVVFNPQNNQPLVSFNVRTESQGKFYQKTQELIGKNMAIVLDDVPVSAPTVQAAISDSGQISGQFTVEEAKQLALQLNAGALKAPVKILSQKNVGATLGNESIQKSLVAGGIGLTLIALFMILNYGFLGFIAVLALIIYTLLTFAVFKLMPVTLTLAGIAGFILSIGMAVDANILIFERMKEEMHWGKEKNAALKLGFDRAMSSIKASNISTLITTIILYWFGSGMVRGFALTLAIGVLISMFSAIYVTRTLLNALYRKGV